VEDRERARILEVFRKWGYLHANVDPLGRLQPLSHAELDNIGEAGRFARVWYAGTIGAEFMHIPDTECRRWIEERLEADPPAIEPGPILDRLIAAEVLEEVLQARYPGTKRFSLEGATSLIPPGNACYVGSPVR